MEKSSNKLWSSSFIKITLVNFFIFVNFHALLPTFPFFVTHLGGDAVAIGLATALFSLASILSRPFIGWLVDSKGRSTVLVLGLIGMSLLPMGYFFAAGIAFAVVMRTIHGAFHAASSNAASTWVADIVPPARMGEGLGMFGLSMALSTAAAPAIGLAIMNQMGFRALFILATLAGVIALAIGLSIKSRNYKLSEKPLKFGALFEKKSAPAAITQFFFMMTYGVVEVYVAIYATENNLPSGGIYFILIAVATVASRIFLGRVIDYRGEGILVYTGNAAIICGILLLVFVHTIPAYVVSALLLGYSFGAVQPSLQTMSMHAVAPERRGAASSTFFCAFDLGIALGGFVAGVLIKWLGYDMMFLCIALSCIFSLLYYYIYGRNHESSMNPHKPKASQPIANRSAATPRTNRGPLVVTISREYGSGGHVIGQLLAQQLHVPFYDNALIEMTAKESGLDQEFVQANEQQLRNFRLYDLYPGISNVAQGAETPEQAMFFAQSKIIRDLAQRESCVIVGRLANFILKENTNCVNFFIYADEAFRTERLISEYHIEPSQATAALKRTDEQRREHCRHYTGCSWGAYEHYHLCVNSAELGIERTAQLLLKLVEEQKNR